VLEATRNGPAGAPADSCWGKTVSPAVVQTVEEQVQIKPAKVNADGTIAAPPEYRRTTRQEIVSPRRDNWFETPCDDVLTPEFVATLQRALSARGFYAGVATGLLDTPTRAAVQAFQRDEGPDSPVLSLAAARKLGLIAVERTASE
jgi:peptidoglycan hydrolase-like protein with peptidoglycan-binding domain